MGELMRVGGTGGLDYLKSCNKHIYSYRNYQHPGMHFYFLGRISNFKKIRPMKHFSCRVVKKRNNN